MRPENDGVPSTSPVNHGGVCWRSSGTPAANPPVVRATSNGLVATSRMKKLWSATAGGPVFLRDGDRYRLNPQLFEVDLWRAQNAFYRMLETAYPRFASDPDWRSAFGQLGDRLNVRVPVIETK